MKFLPPAGIFRNRRGNDLLIFAVHTRETVQAGTPMTVTEEGILSLNMRQDVPFTGFFRSQISPGVRGRAAPGLRIMTQALT